MPPRDEEEKERAQHHQALAAEKIQDWPGAAESGHAQRGATRLRHWEGQAARWQGAWGLAKEEYVFMGQVGPNGQERRGNDTASCLKGLHAFCDMGRGQDPNTLNLAMNQLPRLRETDGGLYRLLLSRALFG